MSNQAFFNAFSAVIAETEIASKGGLSYLSAATAMRLAGRPEVAFVDFDGKPHLECLGGSLVAVDVQIPGTIVTQRMWLPVMDRDNQALALANTKATDINNSRQRCLVKAVAAVYGNGMSLYMAVSGDGAKAAKILKVQPDTDLLEVAPVVATLKEGGAPYVEWTFGLAACRITDPEFFWDVVMWEGVDGRLPYREVLGGLMVDVDTVYRGKRQRLSLPIMDAAFNPLSKEKATVFDWNKSVMRALTKCIAFNSGYGLSVYAEDLGNEPGTSPSGQTRKDTKSTAKATGKGADKAEAKADAAPAAKADATPVAEAAPAAEAKQDAVAETPAADATPVAEAKPEVAAQPEAQAETKVNEAEAALAAAVADAAPAADATPVAEAAPAAEAKQEAAADASDAITRFKGVMAKRREAAGTPGLISLFKALADSDKFAVEDKPSCFAVLVPALAAVVSEVDIAALVANVTKYKAMQYLAQDARDLVASRLTAVAVTESCPKGDGYLLEACDALVKAGIAADTDDVLRLAKQGGIAAETLTLMHELVVLDKTL